MHLVRRRLASFVCAALALTAAVAASPAVADEVVLDNGRTLVGRVVSDDGTTLKIEMATGTMSIERRRVTSVKRAPLPAKAPEASPGEKPVAGGKPAGGPAGKLPGSASAPAPASSSAAPTAPVLSPTSPYRPVPRTVAAQLAELESTRLRPWSVDPRPEVRNEDRKKPWKIERTDGRVEFLDTSPSNGDGVAKAWQMARPNLSVAMLRDGQEILEWRPMYWCPERGGWWTISPELDEFQRFDGISKNLLLKFCNRDVSAWVACNVLVLEMARKQGGSSTRNTSVSIEAERAQLRETIVKATGSAAMAADAARCLEIENDMKWSTPAEQIRLGEERVRLLRKLSQAAPDVK